MSEDATQRNSEEQPKKKVFGRPFLPGQSGNPSGRPKGSKTLTGILRELLDKDVPGAVEEHGMPLTYAQLLVRTAIKHAAQGNPTFFREILERMDGKVPDRIEAKLGGNWSMEYEPVDETPDAPPAGEDGDDA